MNNDMVFSFWFKVSGFVTDPSLFSFRKDAKSLRTAKKWKRKRDRHVSATVSIFLSLPSSLPCFLCAFATLREKCFAATHPEPYLKARVVTSALLGSR
jgi:hypothetical protein